MSVTLHVKELRAEVDRWRFVFERILISGCLSLLSQQIKSYRTFAAGAQVQRQFRLLETIAHEVAK